MNSTLPRLCMQILSRLIKFVRKQQPHLCTKKILQRKLPIRIHLPVIYRIESIWYIIYEVVSIYWCWMLIIQLVRGRTLSSSDWICCSIDICNQPRFRTYLFRSKKRSPLQSHIHGRLLRQLHTPQSFSFSEVKSNLVSLFIHRIVVECVCVPRYQFKRYSYIFSLYEQKRFTFIITHTHDTQTGIRNQTQTHNHTHTMCIVYTCRRTLKMLLQFEIFVLGRHCFPIRRLSLFNVRYYFYFDFIFLFLL